MKVHMLPLALAVACWTLGSLETVAAAAYTLSKESVEYLSTPSMGIDVPTPRFGWVLERNATNPSRGDYQSAFRVVVHECHTKMTVWDSGRVNSSESRHVVFGSVGTPPAAPLKSATAYDWTLEIFVAAETNNKDTLTEEIVVSSSSSSFSSSPSSSTSSSNNEEPVGPGHFVTGILNPEDWNGAQWLIPPTNTTNLCRRAFKIKDNEIQSAILVMAGLGYFQATINGQRVTDAELESGWTDYTRRVPYSTYDVTHLVNAAEKDHVLGVSLGNGWYATNGGGEPTETPRTFIATLFVDGKELWHTQATHDSFGDAFHCGTGPILYDSLYHGEIFDSRTARLVANWDTLNFNPTHPWTPALLNPNPPTGILTSPKMPPIRKVTELSPLSITEPQSGVFIVDFGQNFAGRVSISGLPRKGRTGNMTIRHAEVLQHAGIVPNPQPGMLYVDNLRSARATDVFLFDDSTYTQGKDEDDVMVYEPTFTYHGFRYIEITGYEPRLSDLKGVVLHTDVEHIGSVTFSDPLLNKLQSAIHWGQRSNLMSVPTDCPQRDERKGWLGDAQLSGEEALFNFDMVATLIKFLHDIADTQDVAGQIADTAPYTFGGRPADPSWGSAFPSLVYFLYKETGDEQIVREFYPALSRYVESVLIPAEIAGLANLYKSYGDWCPLPGTAMCSPHLTGSFSFLENLGQMAELARVVRGEVGGGEEEGRIYEAYHSSFTKAFHRAFYVNGTYDVGVQTCLALPLWANAMPADLRTSVAEKLLTNLVHTNNYHATTGIIGMKYMLEVLSHLGKTDVATTMLLQKTYPSFGYMLLNENEPATTIWELWNSDNAGPGMNSRNHIMFGGSVGGWFYRFLGGVRSGGATKETAGYKEVIFAPPLAACMPLEKVSTLVRTVQGPVGMEWWKSNNNTHSDTDTDTQAATTLQTIIIIPLSSKGRVLLDGRALGTAPALGVYVDGVELNQALVTGTVGLEVLQADDKFVEMRLSSGTWAVSVNYVVGEEARTYCASQGKGKGKGEWEWVGNVVGGVEESMFDLAEGQGLVASA